MSEFVCTRQGVERSLQRISILQYHGDINLKPSLPPAWENGLRHAVQLKR